MNVSTHDERTLTELDHARLVRLLRGLGDAAQPRASHRVHAVLDAAALVSPRAVAPDVVTMYSQVQLADAFSGRRYRLTVCYPEDADPKEGFVSVLSPVGASLLGLRVGALARWRGPTGESHAAEVVAILFQPEASGDFTL
jgi:regulator of nucleoside diphosphate kinase